MKLQTLLEEAIYNHLSGKKYEPTLIVVHPRTYRELVAEINQILSFHLGDNLKYRGIKVLRSHDVEENKFEIA